MQEPKVARENAEAEVDLMLEALGVDSPDGTARENLIQAAMEGRVTFDPVSEQGVYKLARPVSLENGEKLTQASFHEPNGEEMQYIAMGQRIEVDTDGKKAYGDSALVLRRAIRYLTKVSNVPLGVAERMKARDLIVIEGIAGFFQ